MEELVVFIKPFCLRNMFLCFNKSVMPEMVFSILKVTVSSKWAQICCSGLKDLHCVALTVTRQSKALNAHPAAVLTGGLCAGLRKLEPPLTVSISRASVQTSTSMWLTRPPNSNMASKMRYAGLNWKKLTVILTWWHKTWIRSAASVDNNFRWWVIVSKIFRGAEFMERSTYQTGPSLSSLWG